MITFRSIIAPLATVAGLSFVLQAVATPISPADYSLDAITGSFTWGYRDNARRIAVVPGTELDLVETLLEDGVEFGQAEMRQAKTSVRRVVGNMECPVKRMSRMRGEE